MLGEAVYRHFAAKYRVRATDINARCEWLSVVDVANYADLYEDVSNFHADVIINLAAQTDLEYCETNPDQAWRDNALGAENAALIAEKLSIPIVYVSTAGIFDGSKLEYNDYDEPNPLTVYARSKLHGERFTERTASRYFVLRAGWMMGGGPDLDKKFVNKLYKQILSGNTLLHAVTDKLGTPTYTHNFAQGMERVLMTDYYGVYNQVCEGRASRFEVAEYFVACLGLTDRIRVEPVTSDYFASEYFAARPASEQLTNFKLKQRGLSVMRHWKDCLDEYAAIFREGLRRGYEAKT